MATKIIKCLLLPTAESGIGINKKERSRNKFCEPERPSCCLAFVPYGLWQVGNALCLRSVGAQKKGTQHRQEKSQQMKAWHGRDHLLKDEWELAGEVEGSCVPTERTAGAKPADRRTYASKCIEAEGTEE